MTKSLGSNLQCLHQIPFEIDWVLETDGEPDELRAYSNRGLLVFRNDCMGQRCGVLDEALDASEADGEAEVTG